MTIAASLPGKHKCNEEANDVIAHTVVRKRVSAFELSVAKDGLA